MMPRAASGAAGPAGAAGGAPPALPISALLAGALSLLVGAVYLALDPAVLTGYLGSPRVLATTHLLTIGFVTLVYLGTLQQLPAVLLVTDLAWPRMGLLSLPLFVVGCVLLVSGFAVGVAPRLLASGGILLTVALGLAFSQLLATAATRPPRDPGGRGLITAVAYLFLTVFFGLLLAGARASPQLATITGYPASLHQLFGLAGAFLLGIAASGQKLLTMFALSKGGKTWRLTALTYAIHVAMIAALARAVLPLSGGGDGFDQPLKWLALAGLASAAALQLWEVMAILRRRLRKRLEAPVLRYVASHAFLPLSGVLLLFGLPEAATASFLLGFVGLAVSGMLVKILSFLTWTSVYARRGRREQPPLLRDLVVPWLEPLITWGLALGALATSAAIAMSSEPAAVIAAGALVIGAAAQLAQVVVIVQRTLFGVRRAAPAVAPVSAGVAKGSKA